MRTAPRSLQPRSPSQWGLSRPGYHLAPGRLITQGICSYVTTNRCYQGVKSYHFVDVTTHVGNGSYAFGRDAARESLKLDSPLKQRRSTTKLFPGLGCARLLVPVQVYSHGVCRSLTEMWKTNQQRAQSPQGRTFAPIKEGTMNLCLEPAQPFVPKLPCEACDRLTSSSRRF